MLLLVQLAASVRPVRLGLRTFNGSELVQAS